MNSIYFTSLGCDKNLSDTEHMLYLLSEAGYVFVDDVSEADIAIINTCCFISDAMEESINTIIEIGSYKEDNLRKLIITGCLAQRHSFQIFEELPEVDAVLGTNSYHRIVEIVSEVRADKNPIICDKMDFVPDAGTHRLLTTGGHYAYLKIAEGCNKGCTYCIIPSIRGRYRSTPMEALLAEARELVDGGVKELILVAQETTQYGFDIYGEKSLHKLLRELSAIDELKWIRLLYAYPEEIYDELIFEMRDNPKVLHYLDMPIQHSEDRILKRMARRTNQADIRNIIAKLRKEMPDICLRTTLICGFPGESEEDHKNMVSFIKEMRFDRLGCFSYSRQEDTPAHDFIDQVDEEIKAKRLDTLMRTQADISASINESFIGRELDVFIEGSIPEEGIYVGRSYRDMPDVDGYVFIDDESYHLESGMIIKARVSGAKDYDLVADFYGGDA